MRTRSMTAAVLAVSALFCGGESRGDDLNELIRPGAGRSRRVSSHDPNWLKGNADWRVIEAGETITLADIEGAGIIRHIWFTVNAYDREYPRSLVLRMYWDNSETPSVETPLGDFFASGFGKRQWIDSQPVAVTSDGRAYNCYWSMPFRERAKVTITNEATYRVPKFYFYIDYDEVDQLPEDVLYFHAQYRQEWPTDEGDYLVCETTGRGHYVGTVMNVQLRTRGWFGEGDDRFYIDGEQVPGLHGTGTEDYFCDAWGFREFNRDYYGVVMIEGFQFGDRVNVYRWHIFDPIRFNESLRFEIEHKGTLIDEDGRGASGHGERRDLFSTVAFWYQTPIAKRFAEVPPLAERVLPATTIEMEEFIQQVEAPRDTDVRLGGGGEFSGARTLVISPSDDDAVVTVPFKVDEPIRGAGRLVLLRSISQGIWRVSLDGEVIPRGWHIDLFSPYYMPKDYNLGYVDLDAGWHELRFECQGKRGEARQKQLVIDAIRVEDVDRFRVPVATPAEK